MNGKPTKPGEIAKTLGVSTVTVRNYVREFQQFLSAGATGDTNRRFTPEDVRTLKVASTLLRDGFTYEQVRSQLEEHLPMEGDILDTEEPHQEEPHQETPSAIQPLEFFTRFVDALRQEHQAHVDTLKAENARLQAEVDWLRQPFFVRWFRKPPGAP